MPASSSIIIQITSISTALLASGGIATLSLFDIPELQSQPASRSLPLTRWLFSRGSHIFPSAAILSSTGFALLAYNALPSSPNSSAVSTFVQHLTRGGPVSLYVAAAALSASIGPITTLIMLPTNFKLIEMNERLGGARSEKSADTREGDVGGKARSAEESVDGKGDVSQWSDLSKPQSRTQRESSKEEDEEVKRLLSVFSFWNSVRAVAIGLGGVAGLTAALA
ncbi:hypothetical protein DM02DRAFT_618038 [Periconia macrospinosa]|uniref:DUF1772-domain-containing protein n=1 Tax=Periconia macrospinosa TaxID=97972 RepID=A0A2V1DDE3_9PLEO|nr:hypothetical protein DM02DRAFT_618038 [Periconia macrospinosa]